MRSKAFDPNQWSGNTDDLIGFHEGFMADHDLCDQTFTSKQEAFTAGWVLATKASKSGDDGPRTADA
jgi:hypothetical protein